jgi:DNA-directed RNA polymerase subunit RPC12/RpoP
MARDSEERKAEPRSGMADGVLVQVCVECGKEYFYDDSEPPADQKCERCGNTVFRSFFDVTSEDEVETDFADTTERDVTPDQPATDVTRGDLYDLNNP